jgi:hypothetical protein
MSKTFVIIMIILFVGIAYTATYLVKYEQTSNRVNKFNNECLAISVVDGPAPAENNPNCYQILTAGHGFLWLPSVNSGD